MITKDDQNKLNVDKIKEFKKRVVNNIDYKKEISEARDLSEELLRLKEYINMHYHIS